MRTTTAILAVLLLAFGSAAPAQQYTMPPDMGPTLSTPGAPSLPPEGAAPQPGPTAPGSSTPQDYLGELSDWITYRHCPGCGPIGCNGPVTAELYVRTGPNFPVGNSFFKATLEDGWMVEGGGRTLFFNPEMRAAWLIDLGIGYKYNNGNNPDFTFFLFEQTVNVEALHRVDVYLGAGREWYLVAPAVPWLVNWRVGIDGGGRYGTARLDLFAADTLGLFRRANSETQGLYTGIYTDAEVPFGSCSLFGGLRFEYSVNWNDLLPFHNTQLQDLSLLMYLGLRF